MSDRLSSFNSIHAIECAKNQLNVPAFPVKISIDKKSCANFSNHNGLRRASIALTSEGKLQGRLKEKFLALRARNHAFFFLTNTRKTLKS